MIDATPDLSKIWLKREDDPQEVKKRFTNGSVKATIVAGDEGLAKIYQDLYQRTIDFGAHPNEAGVLTNVIKESVGTGTLQFWMLAGDGPALQHALRTCAQIGICSLRVFNMVFSEQFSATNFEEKIARVSMPF